MRQKVIQLLKKAKLDPVSVENPIYPGTPDLNYTCGWLELKWLRQWPTNDASVVKLDHFTREQRAWLKRRWGKGGNVFLLLQCKMDWLLFDGETAAKYVGRKNRKSLIDISLYTSRSGLRHNILHLLDRYSLHYT